MKKVLTLGVIVLASPVIFAVAVYAAWECNRHVLVFMGDEE